MGANELLFWLSAKRSGSWLGFRSAVQDLMADEEGTFGGPVLLPLQQRVRFNLQQLGHVEFDAAGCAGGWRVTPPVVALSEQNNSTIGILCGARLPKLVRCLEENASEIHVERLPGPEHPDVIRLLSDTNSRFQALAEQSGLLLQPHATVSLLSCLPRITNLSLWHGSRWDLPFGKNTTVNRFKLSKRECRWVPSSVEEARKTRTGLFRFTRFQQREHYLRLEGQTLRVQGQFGNYFVAARQHQQVMRYDRAARQITVPDICRPPLLVDRALILCSGFVPRHDPVASTLTYCDIPEGIAAMAAHILCQEGL